MNLKDHPTDSSRLHWFRIQRRIREVASNAISTWMARDPLFLLLVGIVGLGFALTLGSYVLDRKSP